MRSVALRIVNDVSYETRTQDETLFTLVWSCFDAKLVAVDGVARVQF